MATAAVETVPSTNPLQLNGETQLLAPRDIKTQIGYCKHSADGRKPSMKALADQDPDFTESRTMTVKDVRGEEKKYRFDKDGFEWVKHSFSLPTEDYLVEEKVKEVYYPEMKECIKKVTGATRVEVFNHIIRNCPRRNTSPKGEITKYQGPAETVHIDYAPQGIPGILQKHFSDGPDIESSGRRFQLVNAWRPIKTVERDPLTVMDPRSARESDIEVVSWTKHDGMEVSSIFLRAPNPNPDPDPDPAPASSRGEADADAGSGDATAEAAASAKEMTHRWKYLSRQGPGDVLLFKGFDSHGNSEGSVNAVPHTSFEVEGDEERPTRESIEMRCLVVY